MRSSSINEAELQTAQAKSTETEMTQIRQSILEEEVTNAIKPQTSQFTFVPYKPQSLAPKPQASK
jgi:hypothetical protein